MGVRWQPMLVWRCYNLCYLFGLLSRLLYLM